jgi:hypothetical protein
MCTPYGVEFPFWNSPCKRGLVISLTIVRVGENKYKLERSCDLVLTNQD